MVNNGPVAIDGVTVGSVKSMSATVAIAGCSSSSSTTTAATVTSSSVTTPSSSTTTTTTVIIPANHRSIATTTTTTTNTATAAMIQASSSFGSGNRFSTTSMAKLGHHQHHYHQQQQQSAIAPSFTGAHHSSSSSSLLMQQQQNSDNKSNNGIVIANNNPTVSIQQQQRSTNYILLNKLRVQNYHNSNSTVGAAAAGSVGGGTVNSSAKIRASSVGSTNSSSSRLSSLASIPNTTVNTTKSPTTTTTTTTVGSHGRIVKRDLNHHHHGVMESVTGNRVSLSNVRHQQRPIVTRVNAPFWLQAQQHHHHQKKDTLSSSGQKPAPSAATNCYSPSSTPLSSLADNNGSKKGTTTSKSKLSNQQQSKSLTASVAAAASPGIVAKTIDLAQSTKPKFERHHHQFGQTSSPSSSTTTKQTGTTTTTTTTAAESSLLSSKVVSPSAAAPGAFVGGNDELNNFNRTATTIADWGREIPATGDPTPPPKTIDPKPPDDPERTPSTVPPDATGIDRQKMMIMVQSRKMMMAETESSSSVCDTKKDVPVNIGNSRQLLQFIEKASPEFIFLLNKSAHLSYQMALFERKLNYLERIFDTNDGDSDASDGGGVSPPRLWTKVIAKTRDWIARSRETNIFITNVKLKPFQNNRSSSLATKEQQIMDLIDEWKKMENSNNKTEMTSTNNPSLSSKDELIILLERIAQFSSNIASATSLSSSSIRHNPLDSKPSDDINCDDPEEESNNNTQEKSVRNTDLDDPKTFLNRILNGDDQEQLIRRYAEWLDRLQPEILRELVRIVRTSSLLVQVQREFDLLMCAHLKSYSQSLAKTTMDPNQNNHHGTSLPLSFNQQPAAVATKRFKQQRLQPSQQIRSKSMMPAATDPSQNCHCGKNPEMYPVDHNHHHHHQQTTTKSCCCIPFAVSDGDSGGEFTATTVTNDFTNQCTTDDGDQLSSLLNQIALCSQKIIEQSSNGSSGSNSTTTSQQSPHNSTTSTSSGCCCSAGTCSMAQQPPNRMFKDLMASSDGNSWTSNHQHNGTKCYSVADINRYRATENFNNNQQQFQQLNHAMSFSQLDDRTGRITGFPMKNSNKFKLNFGKSALHQSPQRRATLPPESANYWPLDEPLVERVSNNMTGFMLSSPTFDMISPMVVDNHHQYHHQVPPRRHHQSHHQCTTELNHPATAMAGRDRTGSIAGAFILDLNADVESFLNQMEKELDENERFASAPPFAAATAGMMSSHHHHQHLDRSDTVHNNNDQFRRHQYCSNSHHQMPGQHHRHPQSTGPMIDSKMAPPSYGQLYPPSSMSLVNNGGGHHHQQQPNPQSLLAGGNWKLSQRSTNGTNMEFGRFQTSMMGTGSVHQNHSMPMDGNSNSSGGGQSDPETLDRYRSQVSNRAAEETDRQLKEIDQWLYKHLNQSPSPPAD